MGRKLKKLQFRSPNHYSFIHDTRTTIHLIWSNQSNFLWLIEDQANDYGDRSFAEDTEYNPQQYDEVIDIDTWNGRPCFFTKYTSDSTDDVYSWELQTYPDRYVLMDEIITVNNVVYNRWRKYEYHDGYTSDLDTLGGTEDVLIPTSLNLVSNMFNIQAESVRCDSEGVDLSKFYAKPSNLSPAARTNRVSSLTNRPSLYEYEFIFYKGNQGVPEQYSTQMIIRSYSTKGLSTTSEYSATGFYNSGYYTPLIELWGISGPTDDGVGDIRTDRTTAAKLSTAAINNNKLTVSYYTSSSTASSSVNTADFDWVKVIKKRTVINW